MESAPTLFAIASSRVVTPSGVIDAAVMIEDGKIRAVIGRNDVPSGVPVQDLGDLVISPGIVDTHVHINEPGTDWEGFETATAAAAAGGITSVLDMPLNSSPVTTTVAALAVKLESAQGKCRVDVGFLGGVVPGNETEIRSLVDEGVFGIKAFMCDSGLDEFPAAEEVELRAALTVLKPLGVPLLAHAEIVDADLYLEVSDRRSYEQYAASRPAQFELTAIERLIDLCREYQSPVHIVHLATEKALPMIASAKDSGLPITVESCPHYLHFSSEQIGDGETKYKCAPPIRDESNRDGLRSAVADGRIDTIGSDHSPCPAGLKLLDDGDYFKAWGGIAGLQLTLPVIWTAFKENNQALSLLANRLSQKPAEIFGLTAKGQIAAGFDADFVVWNPDQSFMVNSLTLFHRHNVTPYHECELSGVVTQTYVRGNLVFSSGDLVGKPVGKLLRRLSGSETIAKVLNQTAQSLASTLETCCASKSWIQKMATGGPFANDQEVMDRANACWGGLNEIDYLEAFSAHPRIGDVDSLREKYVNTKAIAGNEQSGVDSASEATLIRLSQANDEYFEKFGFIFIVCATGKSASEMLEILELRLRNDRQAELSNAAAEQMKITKIRLRKLTQ